MLFPVGHKGGNINVTLLVGSVVDGSIFSKPNPPFNPFVQLSSSKKLTQIAEWLFPEGGGGLFGCRLGLK